MSYEIVYEISKFPLLEMIVSSVTIFFIYSITVLILCFKSTVKEVKSEGARTGNILSMIINLALIVIFVLFFGSLPMDGYENEALTASQKYYEGEYSVIEGYAQEVTEGVNGGLFIFTIQDEEFDFSKWFGAYKKKLSGSYLRVYYIEDSLDDNHRIVRIDRLIDSGQG